MVSHSAGETAGPCFAVDRLEPSEVEQGESVEPSATVTNTGGASGSQTVRYEFDGETRGTVMLTLEAGESETVSYDPVEIGEAAVGWYDHGVATEDDRLERQFAVVPADPFERLRCQYRWQFVTGEGTLDHEHDPSVQAAVEELDSTVEQRLERLAPDTGDRVFADMPLGIDEPEADYPDGNLKSTCWEMRELADAYVVPGSRYEGDPDLLRTIEQSLEIISEHFYDGAEESEASWFGWNITMPSGITHTLALVADELPEDLVDDLLAASADHAREPTLDLGSGDLTMTALIWIRYGTVAEDGDAIRARGRDSLAPALEFSEENNVKPDGSAIAHGAVPYNGHYQAKLIDNFPRIVRLLRGTPWSVLAADFPGDIEKLYAFAYETYDPIMWRGQPMVMVTGRFQHGRIKQTEGRRITRGFTRLGRFAPRRHASYVSSRAKGWLERNTTDSMVEDPDGLEEYALASGLLNDESAEAAEPLERYKQYYNMDRAVHHETTHGSYALGLAMYSERIRNYEALGNSGNGPKRAWFTSYGMTYVYTENLAHFRDGYFQTVDAERLPGTTTNPAAVPDLEPNLRGVTSHAGGVEFHDRFGTSAMVLTSPVDPAYLTAHKSWFCFGDAVVCLGSGIAGDGGDRQVATTVANRTLGRTDTGTVQVDGEETAASAPSEADHDSVGWAHLAHSTEAFGNEYSESIGYVFPERPSVRLVREANSTEEDQTGTDGFYGESWAEEPPYTRYYATLVLEHGTDPDSAGYVYAVLPDTDATTTEAYASEPPFEVLERSRAVHAVRHGERSVTGIQAFEAASVGDTGIVVDGAASVMTRETDAEVAVAVADPTQERDSVEVKLPDSGLEPASVPEPVTVEATDPLRLVVTTGELESSRAGRTLTTTFRR